MSIPVKRKESTDHPAGACLVVALSALGLWILPVVLVGRAIPSAIETIPTWSIVTGLGLVVAADPPKSASDPETVRKSAAFDQERLRQQYSTFQQSLLSLAQKLSKSPKLEDQEKAAALRQAIQ